MAATVVNASNLQDTIKEGVALIDFWAPWCGPCKVQLPIVEELSEELADQAVIGKVNVDEEGELAGQFGISSIPTLILFKDGQPVEKLVGLQSKDSLKARIAQYSK